jgi:hypothetical protein
VNKNYIVLNGKHYDAVTGALIKSAATPVHAAATHTRVTHSQPTRQHVAQSAAKTFKKNTSRSHHNTSKPVTIRKPENSKTLMRHAVKKPSAKVLPHVKQAYPVAKTASGGSIAPKKSAHSVDGLRSRRAQEIHKSKHIARFATPATVPIATKVQPIAIKEPPVHTKKAQPTHPRPHTSPTAHKSHPNAKEKKDALFEHALANATSHEEKEPTVKRRFKHRRVTSSLAGLAAVLVVVGFVAYMNKASVEMQFASVRAGFQASLPNYTPVGYERKDMAASNGKVAITFVSPTQKGHFTLTQEASSWDSQTLFDSIVAADNTTYQAVQSNGRTIYIYGNDKAAWVDGGILYKITGNAKLDSDQVISLAASM